MTRSWNIYIGVVVFLTTLYGVAYAQWDAHRSEPYNVCGPPINGKKECCRVELRMHEEILTSIDDKNVLRCKTTLAIPASIAWTFWDRPSYLWDWPKSVNLKGLPLNVGVNETIIRADTSSDAQPASIDYEYAKPDPPK